MITQEEFEFCKVKVHYSAEADLVKSKYDEAVNLLKKSKVSIPGFRPGKATDLAIKQKMKAQIHNWVTRELVSEAYDETLYETKIKPIGYPEVHHSRLDANSFECDMTFLKKPKIELKDYKNIEIPEPHLEFSLNAETEKTIQHLRVQFGDVVPYGENDFVQEGDKITLDAKAFIFDENAKDYHPLEALTMEGMLYSVGDRTLPEFDHNIYGMKAGDNKEFNILFEDSEKYHEEIRGKNIKFKVNVHMGTKTVPCPLDDSLAQKVGMENYEQFLKEVEGSVSVRANQVKAAKVQQNVLSKLVEMHEFEVPYWLVLMESQKEAYSQGRAWDELTDDQIDALNEQSKKRVKLSLLLDEIRDNEPEVVFSEKELVDSLRKNLEDRGQNAIEVLSRAQKDGSLIGTIAAMRDELTIKWLVDQAKLVN